MCILLSKDFSLNSVVLWEKTFGLPVAWWKYILMIWHLFHIIKMYRCCQLNVDALLHFLSSDVFTHGSVTKDLIVNA